MTPFGPGFLGLNPYAQQPVGLEPYPGLGAPPPSLPAIDPNSPVAAAILAALSGMQRGAASVAQLRHYGPAEGPLGENAHLGWGTAKPMTTASPRKAAPTRKTKLGGYVGPANYSSSAHGRLPHYGPIFPSGAKMPPAARAHMTGIVDTMRRILADPNHLGFY